MRSEYIYPSIDWLPGANILIYISSQWPQGVGSLWLEPNDLWMNYQLWSARYRCWRGNLTWDLLEYIRYYLTYSWILESAMFIYIHYFIIFWIIHKFSKFTTSSGSSAGYAAWFGVTKDKVSSWSWKSPQHLAAQSHSSICSLIRTFLRASSILSFQFTPSF